MPLTPETLPRHELVGLDVEVVAASNPDAVGISGTVVVETTQMLAVEGADRVWHVPKDSATFAFDLPSGQRVRVDGSKLVARPARRTEKSGDSKWR
ncbi:MULTISPECIES: ribonuclease P protein component 1 [Haloarcula]|uniref:Ribonuclease P protein component 1 n=1 Tax=Haloarcula pellucida TaxID=1427151 RepID=A0A830GN72_9EURY|nr:MULTISPECIES: ribonuclease P protein component 1 [Halomicroarcula]MBX0348169.1 ribonuclease P protein component 1 [Halomicroarcula pellucida]MDS0278013.1 ribonuclease P protein component 1 [Halomicroarcula sp. S1AR25-4]QIO23665.1 ribonuclease P protein component 1 [Haloarcula sp. JP-L23]GGN97296.1 ribonuclease P [Halomicroarcula pellucida]